LVVVANERRLGNGMRIPRNSRIVAGIAALVVTLASVLLLAASRDWQSLWMRLMRLPAGIWFALVTLLLVLVVGPVLIQEIRRRKRKPDAERAALPVPDALSRAAGAQAKRAGEFIDRVSDPARREQLGRELSTLQAERQGEISTLHVAVFGTVSAGKTSLINALIGRNVGTTEAVMGTTRHGESHTYELKSVDAAVFLTDTPGMSEAGEGGEAREAEARTLAVRADLLLFVVDHDLIRSEYAPLIELARLGKRSIVVLNKKDRFPEEDLAAIQAKLSERLSGVVDPADIVTVAAAPRPMPVRVQRADGSFDTVLELEPPDILDLRSRIGEVLRREGKFLHAANLLVRGRVLEQEAQEQLARERDRQAMAVVERHQWITAGTVFANPIPAMDILAGGAVQLDMIADLARTYGVEPSSGQIRGLAAQMVQAILKLGLAETATSLVAGVFKRTVVGFAAGGAVQAVAMAYLTRVSGKAFTDYFRQNQSWGPDGIYGVVLHQFEQTSRAEFLQDFASQVVERVLHKVLPGLSPATGKGDR
jgi:small GTP-binding protein